MAALQNSIVLCGILSAIKPGSCPVLNEKYPGSFRQANQGAFKSKHDQNHTQALKGILYLCEMTRRVRNLWQPEVRTYCWGTAIQMPLNHTVLFVLVLFTLSAFVVCNLVRERLITHKGFILIMALMPARKKWMSHFNSLYLRLLCLNNYAPLFTKICFHVSPFLRQ